MGRVGLAPLRKPGCPHIFIDRGFQSRPVCRVCAVSRTTARPVPGLRGTGEPGVGSLPEARGLWFCLSPLVQFPWSNRGLSPPSSDPPGVRHGRPFDLSASRRRRSRGLRRLAAHPHRVRSAGRRQRCARGHRPSPSPRGILGDGSPPLAAVRSRSASSGTGTSPRRFAALLTARSGRSPPRRRSRVIDRGVVSAPLTRWASTSRTRQPVHQEAEFHAVSSSDSIRSANWRRRRATSRCISTASTTRESCKSTGRTAQSAIPVRGTSRIRDAVRRVIGLI